MNNRLVLILRVFASILLSIAVIQIFAGIDPVYREDFPTFFLSLLTLLFVTFLPHLLSKFNIEVSKGLYYVLIFTTLTTIVGGYGFKLYQVLDHYDTVIHLFNGGVLVLFGFAFIKFILNEQENHVIKIAIVAFLLAITLGVMWEIYEFIVDTFLNRNMQRFEDVITGEPLIGQAALHDTMIDLIVDTIGAIFATFLLIRSYYREGKFIGYFTITKIEQYDE